jgi:Mn-containing catalase
MFYHTARLQYHAKPDKPDPAYARKLQEVLGGQWGEMSVMMMYLFQGWNCRGPQKYRDMIMSIGAEEIGHVEMLATMIARLLESASPDDVEKATKDPAVGAVVGGTRVDDAVAAAMNPQHLIVSGLGAMPTDSVGYPWTSRYIVASGNLLADFRMNVTAESQGRLQVARLYHMTTDAGVREMLSFMLARDTMHQNQWLAAIEELEADALDFTPCPAAFDVNLEKREVAYQLWANSDGPDASEGRWATGVTPDGKGDFEFIARPEPLSGAPTLAPIDPRFFGTPAMPIGPVSADGPPGRAAGLTDVGGRRTEGEQRAAGAPGAAAKSTGAKGPGAKGASRSSDESRLAGDGGAGKGAGGAS